MGFINDYLYYGSGDECPQEFQLWSALSLLSSVLGRKVWCMHGDYFQILPNIYVCLVGEAGSGKSTARGRVKKIVARCFPWMSTSSSFQSFQDIVDLMANAPTVDWKDEKGEYLDKIQGKIYDYRPFYIIANELASLLSTDKQNMVTFLTDIYDENEFSTGYKNQRRDNPERKQRFENPYVSLLSCAVPKWFMGNLKLDLFDGGLGRRLIIVVGGKTKLVDDPVHPPGAQDALERAVAHLKLCENVYGEVRRSSDAMKWWKEWYHDKTWRNRDDPILMQFDETMPVQVLKVAMLLCMSEHPFTMTIERVHLIAARDMLFALRPSIQKLTSGLGRNEIAGIGAQLIEHLDRVCQGAASEVQIRKFFHKALQTREFQDEINHRISVGELYLVPMEHPVHHTMVNFYMLPGYYHGGNPTGRKYCGGQEAGCLKCKNNGAPDNH